MHFSATGLEDNWLNADGFHVVHEFFDRQARSGPRYRRDGSVGDLQCQSPDELLEGVLEVRSVSAARRRNSAGVGPTFASLPAPFGAGISPIRYLSGLDQRAVHPAAA